MGVGLHDFSKENQGAILWEGWMVSEQMYQAKTQDLRPYLFK